MTAPNNSKRTSEICHKFVSTVGFLIKVPAQYLWLAAFHWAVCQLHGAMEIHAHNLEERIFVLGVGVGSCIFYRSHSE